jgi:glycosyltransferase involved in cell wall biosynthesis
MKVLMTMANNSFTAYFDRFAKLSHQYEDVEFVFVCMYPETPKMVEGLKALGCKCHWIKYDDKKRKMGFLKVFFAMLSIILKEKPDVLHCHLFDDSMPSLMASYLLRVRGRVISKFDTGYHYNFTPSWVKFDKFNNFLATHLIAISDESEKFILDIEKADQAKLSVIHCGIDPEEVSNCSEKVLEELKYKFKLGEYDNVVLKATRYIEWKGYRYVIGAIKTVLEKNPSTTFLFVGYGEQKEELEELVNAEGVEANVQFIGFVSREELNGLMRLCDVYIHASTDEPFGYVIGEAMINGLACVFTPTGAAHDSVNHLENGYLVKLKDSKTIADGINYMIENDVEQIKANAKETATRMFHVDNVFASHVEVYRDSIAQ